MTCTCAVPPWPSPLPDETAERDDHLDQTLVGSQSEEDGNREPKKTVKDGDRKKTDQEGNARSDRLKEDKFRPAPTACVPLGRLGAWALGLREPYFERRYV